MGTLFSAFPSLTPQITTGNFFTVNDVRDTTKPNNNAQNPLGAIYRGIDANNRPVTIRYVQYDPTVAVTDVQGPVFWKDNTLQVVTPQRTEAVTAGDNSLAGILLNASITDLNFTFIMTYGFLAGMLMPGSVVKDDLLIAGTGVGIYARIAADGAITNRLLAVALTDEATSLSDILVVLEP